MVGGTPGTTGTHVIAGTNGLSQIIPPIGPVRPTQLSLESPSDEAVTIARSSVDRRGLFEVATSLIAEGGAQHNRFEQRRRAVGIGEQCGLHFLQQVQVRELK
jgi:hypothetical protein